MEFPVSIRSVLLIGAVGLAAACQATQPAAPRADDANGERSGPEAPGPEQRPEPPGPGGQPGAEAEPEREPELEPEPPLTALKPHDPPALAQLDRTRAAHAERVTPPISGGTLATASETLLIAADPDRDRLIVIDLAENSARSVALEPGDEPGRVVVHDARAYVALRGAGALATLDLETASVTARTAVCAAPRGVAYDPARARVLVACAHGELVSVSEDGARVSSSAFIESDLRDVGVDDAGIWVSLFRRPALLRLDANAGVLSRSVPADMLTTTPLGNTTSNAFSPTLAFRTIQLGSAAPLMLHQRAQRSAIATEQFQSYGGGNQTFCESGIVHATVTRFDAEQPAALAALPQAVVPVDLAISSDARLLAAVAPGNFVRQDIVEFPSGFGGPSLASAAQQLYLFDTSRLDARSGQPSSVPFETGERDCLLDAPRWEHRFPGEAIALQFVGDDSLVVQVREPAELHVFRLDETQAPRLSAIIELGGASVRDTGHQVFHQNSGTGIACASCHGEALDDGHVWNFNDVGTRRTQSLRGDVVATAPFHWTGEFASFEALTEEIFGRRMGGGALGLPWRDALQTWLASVPPLAGSTRQVAAAARGRALFQSSEVQCSSCHAGDALRSDGRYDVGTGGSFEVPSLRGVALRLPLMHDGCATTLRGRFDASCGGGDRHGRTAQLSPEQLDELVAYLESL
jgi:mono/diheme cytochrome c family protein